MEAGHHSPQWRRVINLSISCCLTSLLILGAALILGFVGVVYKQVGTSVSSLGNLPQAACIMVDAVLFQLTAFFALFGERLQITTFFCKLDQK